MSGRFQSAMATFPPLPTRAPEGPARALAGGLLRREPTIVLCGLAVVTALAWAYLFHMARGMEPMETAMPQTQAWGNMDFILMFIMWVVMMVAMMTPTATPMVLMFARVNRGRREQRKPYVPTGVFLLGYLAVWSGFSVLATVAQWGLHSAALLSPMLVSTSPALGGALLLAAGAYQWTPLKHACLRRCRSPLGFILNEWREGAWGAFLMGLKHGGYCTGCCWVLMALLFVTGVMNLLWVAVIAGFILLEKVASAGYWLDRVAGILLMGWGLWMIAGMLSPSLTS